MQGVFEVNRSSLEEVKEPRGQRGDRKSAPLHFLSIYKDRKTPGFLRIFGIILAAINRRSIGGQLVFERPWLPFGYKIK